MKDEGDKILIDLNEDQTAIISEDGSKVVASDPQVQHLLQSVVNNIKHSLPPSQTETIE